MPEHISSYSHLAQYSTEISKQADKTQIKEGWRKSNHVDTMAQILKYGDNYRCMMKMKAKVQPKLDMAGPEPVLEKKYPRFCGAKVKKYRNVATLFGQIGVSELKALLTGYLNLSEDVVDHCHIREWKSPYVKVELMPWPEYQVETIQRIRYTVK